MASLGSHLDAARRGSCHPLESPTLHSLPLETPQHALEGAMPCAAGTGCPAPGPTAPKSVISDPAASEWIGAEVRRAWIGDREYRLSFVFLGGGSGDRASASIDPGLPVAEAAVADPGLPPLLTTYDRFDPATRRAFLEWIDTGRCDPSVPTAFPLHLVHCLEAAMLEEGRHDLARIAAAELERLLQVHGGDRDFRGCAQSLREACKLLDADCPVAPIFASARTNHGDEMPFAERLYLGQALKNSPCLEADPALLFLLEQPRTWLDAHVVSAFDVVYHHWTENYSYRFNGGVELQPTSTLSLVYESLDGEATFELRSTLPDPASAPEPPGLRQFFVECCAEVDALRDLHVAQRKAIIKGLKSKSDLRGHQPAWSLRPDFEERVRARLAGPEVVMLRASDLLVDLFEDASPPPNKQVPMPACRRMWRALGDLGVGFEPDDRYGLPARIRPDSQVALFREEPLPFNEPSDAFHLAQAAMTLSAIGTRTFAGLEPLRAGEIELRLPYRHRYSARELRRLEASFLVMREAGKPRELLASWPRRMKRLQRLKHIDLGFGIAFHAQAGNPLVKRFATAVSKALHNDDRRVEGFLRQVNLQAEIDSGLASLNGAKLVPLMEHRGVARAADAQSHQCDRVTGAQSPIDGLSPVLSEILEALLQRPRSRTELNDIARRGQLQLAGALEQLNEWSLGRLNAHVTRGHQPVRINPEVFDAVELIVTQQ